MKIAAAMLGMAMLSGAAVAQPLGLRIGLRDDPDLIDPTLSRTYVGTLVMTAMCDKLYDFGQNRTFGRSSAGSGLA